LPSKYGKDGKARQTQLGKAVKNDNFVPFQGLNARIFCKKPGSLVSYVSTLIR